MPSLKRTTPCAVSLAIILATTAVLFHFKDEQQHHPVFFYLIPAALVAMIYNLVQSVVGVIFSILLADFFLYDPIYSLYVSDPDDIRELIIFAVIAIIVAKAISELRRDTVVRDQSR